MNKNKNTSSKPNSEESNKSEIINLQKKVFDFMKRGEIDKLKEVYEKQILLGLEHYETFANLGAINWMKEDYDNVKVFINKALELKPNHAGALNTLGNILDREGSVEEAIHAFEKSIKINPHNSNALYNLANSKSKLGNYNDAISLYKKSIILNPNFIQSYNNLAKILEKLSYSEQAENYYTKTIKINPNFSAGYNNLGNIKQSKGLLKEAKLLYLKAIDKNPNEDDAIYNLGNVFKKEKNYTKSIEYYQKAININNLNNNAKLELITTLALICDWDQLDQYKKWITEIGIDAYAVSPLELLHLDQDPKRQMKRAQNFWSQNYKRDQINTKYKRKDKIHIGYFSADFRTHPVSMLLSRILELHNKDQFKIILYSLIPEEVNDKYTKRIKSAVCSFRNLSKLNDDEAFNLIQKDNLDFAIDLMGHTQNNRLQLFSYRLAKIQLTYLGYPGTTGSQSIDYIVADKTIIPQKSEKNFSEKIAYMPNCFMSFDNTIKISKKKYTKMELNLDENQFIFTAFHKSQKITRKEFNIWINILHNVPDSVLWLRDMNSQAELNLKKEFVQHELDPKRLIFSKHNSSYEDYLSKFNCGDLFLDTFNYNAHSTGIECLWAGLPILTLSGTSYPSKVGESLLKNFGLEELITYTEKEYNELAIKLGNNPQICKEYKNYIKSNKDKNILFNSEQFTVDFEKLLINLLK